MCVVPDSPITMRMNCRKIDREDGSGFETKNCSLATIDPTYRDSLGLPLVFKIKIRFLILRSHGFIVKLILFLDCQSNIC